ncbi:hypothetical protein BDZ94DRAFT_1241328 [Collybia nuda]|uniref:DUF6533 domain-containing protein n=1 Tax=Collybia nuda TaxID=64659 RepID=A0A9P5XVY5_9AGAR|nr:hypothetical protein BDZ94DRAFT_1241328 [Collybia nuda]
MSLADLLSSAIHDIQATRYAHLASGTIIIYDHLTTLDGEVELIWVTTIPKSSWSIGKWLFIICQQLRFFFTSPYSFFVSLFLPRLPLSGSQVPASCLRFFQWQGFTGLIACVIAQRKKNTNECTHVSLTSFLVILQMRIYALYSLNKKILALMAVCFIASVTVSATIMGMVVTDITGRPLTTLVAAAFRVTPTILFCVPSGVSKHFFAFWIPILFFESLLCSLALYKGFETFRSASSAFRSGRHLVDILVRDSVLYFLIMFATYLTCLLIWITARQTLLEIPIGFSVALSCVLGNRVILNVREVNRELEQARSRPRSVSVSQKVGDGHGEGYYGSSMGTSRVIVPGESSLTEFEMLQLRSLKAEP